MKVRKKSEEAYGLIKNTSTRRDPIQKLGGEKEKPRDGRYKKGRRVGVVGEEEQQKRTGTGR
jgi:hypothetical protein